MTNYSNTIVRFLILIFFITFSGISLADEAKSVEKNKSVEENFEIGFQKITEKKYNESLDLFMNILAQKPDHIPSIINAAIAATELKKYGLALGLYRSAINKNPNLSEAHQGIQYVFNQFKVNPIPHEMSFYNILRDFFLSQQSITGFLTLFYIICFSFGFIFIQYFKKLKIAISTESTRPQFPYIGILFSILFVLNLALLALKFYDTSIVRGTIITPTAAVKAAPSINQTTIYELNEGLEVEILNKNKNWIQVLYPGSFAGWIPEESIFYQN